MTIPFGISYCPTPPLSFLSTIAHPLSTNFSLPNEPVKIKDGSHNFHLQNIEHSHSQMPRVKPHNQKSSTGIAWSAGIFLGELTF